MAFEDVFRGIDFQAPNRAKQFEQQQLMQAIGMGMGQYNTQKDRELKNKQLEQAAQAAQAKAGQFDLKKGGQEALYELNLGMPATPERVALAKAYSQLQTPVFGEGGIQAPSAFQQALGGQQPAQGGIPPMTQAQFDQPVAPQGARPPPALPINREQFDNSKASLVNASPKTKQMVQEEMVKNKIAQSEEVRKFELEKQRSRPLKERALKAAAVEWVNIDGAIDKAIGQVSPWSAGLGSYLSVIPATDAKDLSSTLETITADAAFSTLVDLKASGGTLGAIAKAELDLLKAAKANLSADQSPAQLVENLGKFKVLRNQSMQRIGDGYKDEYGEVPKDIQEMLSAPAAGEKTATNPTTGEKMILKGGKWQKM